VVPVDAIPDGTMGLDIGPDTMDTFHNELAGNGTQDSNGSRTVVWNGPMGVS
jgi:phosphoglycerate kinase